MAKQRGKLPEFVGKEPLRRAQGMLAGSKGPCKVMSICSGPRKEEQRR